MNTVHKPLPAVVRACGGIAAAETYGTYIHTNTLYRQTAAPAALQADAPPATAAAALWGTARWCRVYW